MQGMILYLFHGKNHHQGVLGCWQQNSCLKYHFNNKNGYRKDFWGETKIPSKHIWGYKLNFCCWRGDNICSTKDTFL